MGVGEGARGDAAASVAAPNAAGCHVSHAEDDGIVAPAAVAAASNYKAAKAIQLIAEGRA
jgi:hypothetical protein